MSPFASAHATHPDWRVALALAAAQLEGALAPQPVAATPTLGFAYFTDAYAAHASALLAALQQRWPGVAWVGSVGIGVAACGVEYFDEPALALMLADVPADQFEVFSGARPLRRLQAFSALVHADPTTPDLAELLHELSERTASGYLFGGLASSRGAALHLADGVWSGGLSGVAFGADVALVSRVSQGCQPLGPTRSVTQCERNIVITLDGEPALPCLLRDLGLAGLEPPRSALPRLRGTLVGLSDAPQAAPARAARPVHPGAFGTDVRVRHLIGLDPGRQAVAVAELLQPGMRLAFCQRDVAAARRDLVRICSEIREEVETPHEVAAHGEGEAIGGAASRPFPALGSNTPRGIRGAVYISCTGRGGAHFGGPSAELKIIQHALGEVPLVGFFAAGEIGHRHLYGYTGVLSVFSGGR